MSADKAEASEFLTQRWRVVMLDCAAPAEPAAAALSELLAAYGAPGRHYHSLAHIAALLRLLDQQSQHFADRTAVELAIFYHDAVYDVARKDNEAASARLAQTRLPALAVSPERTQRVARLIEATAHGAVVPDPNDADMLRFLDLDLSILGADGPSYAAYARAVRQEYSIYPDDMYRAGRAKVLQGFLRRRSIYCSAPLRAAWENGARLNLESELRGLGS